MRQFTLSLYEKFDRPIALLDNWHRVNAMIDSGARFPVWVAEEELLLDLGAKLKMENVYFGGFGGSTQGRLYELPYFKLGDLVYPCLNIIACPIDAPCEIVISATMFAHLGCLIDYENHALTVTIPDNQSTVRNLVIEDKEGRLHVLCQSSE